MRRATLLAGLLLLVGCEQKQAAARYDLQAAPSVQPPERYRHDASAIVFFEAPEKLHQVCAPTADACVAGGIVHFRNPCLPDGWPRDPEACHELGHLNGWPADHPQQ